jgi:hypothetical protein
MADIFISYKREDRERIAPLARSLEARGYTVWWDLELVPSQKFERQIKRELDAAKCVIVVWTDRSIADDGMYVSEWVQIEANSGDERGILLPVQLDAGRKHWRHGQNQFAALNGWTGDETAPGFQDLLKGVELHAGARARPQDLELSAWQAAERTETADGFKRFLEAYPQSRFADIARGRIAELEEVAAWQALGAAPTIAALAAFLRRFPAGRFADDAEAKIRAMELASARVTKPPPARPAPPPPPRVYPPSTTEPSSPTAGIPKWLMPAGAAGLALVALLVWSPWNRSNPPGTEAPPIVAEASNPEAAGPTPPAETPPSPVETRPETAPPPTQGAAIPPPESARAQTQAPAPPVAAPSIALPDMVRIPGQNFEAGRYEVTFTEWDACVADGGCNGYRPPDEGWGRGRRPVINVSWNDAQAYVQWLSQRTGRRYRLLTSAEWEIAARAGTTTNFSWGDQDPVCDPNARNGANFMDCTDDRTRPVGSFQPNGFGLYDVHGNVWESVQDAEGSSRVRRGGSWNDSPNWLRSANRSRSDPTDRLNYGGGFRLARTL